MGETTPVVAGNIANGEHVRDHPNGVIPYRSLVRRQRLPNPVRVGDAAELWLLVGTDSGYEGKTTLFYEQVAVTLDVVARG